MNKEEKVLEELKEIFEDVLEDEEAVITEESDMDTVDSWDSLTHLILISEIESRFQCKFTQNEISDAVSVKKILEIIQRKCA